MKSTFLSKFIVFNLIIVDKLAVVYKLLNLVKIKRLNFSHKNFLYS
nr:MAG TPA: hypothetical protein [Caudoviricetes sp.]